MFCECCGAKQKVTSNFCKECGTKIERQSDGCCDGRRQGSEKAELSSQLEATSRFPSRLNDGSEEIDIYHRQPVSNSERPISGKDGRKEWPCQNEEVEIDFAELGTDWYEDVPISEEEMAEYETMLRDSGYSELIKKLDESNSEWSHSTINIAVTGEAGTGKSTLINSLRGLKADDDGAAKTGCTETTKMITCYPHPEYPYLNVWDLPGVGTPNLTREQYFQSVVDFKNYDFLLLVSSTRFKENDMWLATIIMECKPSANLFFIRTKIDNDLENVKQERRKSLNTGELTNIVKQIKEDCLENLKKGGIKDPKVFVINSHKTETFEFHKLNVTLIKTVSDLKRDAMTLCIATLSEDILIKKVEVLSKRISKISNNAALRAAFSNRENNQNRELKILMNEAILYTRHFGVSTESLNLVAKKFRKDMSELKNTIHVQSAGILESETSFEKYYERFEEKYNSSIVDRIPVIGPQRKFRKVQRQSAAVLKSILNMCKSENQRLQTQIALWTNTHS
ncbi:T-cell-specific guanine nucleotide triphosphate-binding protein 2-like [Dreissena polymorpha]|nr:T-cell-specific guanine nucleotide triphosphate-binding protein 2-like [Dreissena polymorpha]